MTSIEGSPERTRRMDLRRHLERPLKRSLKRPLKKTFYENLEYDIPSIIYGPVRIYHQQPSMIGLNCG